MCRLIAAAFLAALLAAPAALLPAPATAAATQQVDVAMPASASPGLATAVTVTLPARVAAVDGRMLFPRGTLEVLGTAPGGKGIAFRPVPIPGGVAFGAYGLVPTDEGTVLEIVVVPRREGRIRIRLLVDAVADADGQRLALAGSDSLATLSIGTGGRVLNAPQPGARPVPTRSAGPARDLLIDGRIDRRDLHAVRSDWEVARENGAACGASAAADVNDDGCLDIVDIQATLAARGQVTATAARAVDPAAIAHTFTVTSTGDGADAAPGNGVCATAGGVCTLRAAMNEADWLAGEDLIAFDLPGTAPVTIQLGSRLPVITARNGGVIIDGYTQPGSRINDAAFGSNAIPGVEIRGNGSGAREILFRVNSPNNTIRGLLINNAYRGIRLDTADAHHNRIVGNWIGFRADGTNPASGNFAVILNVGAHDNVIGSPDLADRNVIGNHSHAIESYGPGVDDNVIQNNLLCIGPSGFTTARCSAAIDHNFGPKDSLIGGNGPNERNVIGPTTLQGIEFSHGWDQSKPWGTDTATTYQINGHRVIGNWVGFRGDGSYDAAFRSGLNQSSSDNGQAINVYDGTNDNLVEDNYIGTVYDGVQVMAPNAHRNIVRGNIIGESPLGQPAPFSGWGIKLRWGTQFDVIAANTIRNAGTGGVGIVQSTVHNVRISRNIVTDTNGTAIRNSSATVVAPPVLSAATTARIAGTGRASATVEVFRASRGVGEVGLPVEYLGSAVVAQNQTWELAVDLDAGDRVTALQIRTDDNTSELAANVAVTQAPDPPGPGAVLVSDDFERTVSNGWGSAPTGGAWVLTGSSSSFSVSGGKGRISVPSAAAREARQSVSFADVVVTGRVSFDHLPDNDKNAFAYIDTRAGASSAYRATIWTSTNGVVKVRLKKLVGTSETNLAPEVTVAGVSAAGGTELAFRHEVIGDQLRLRLWAAGSPEPGAWTTTVQDSSVTAVGMVGLRSYMGSGITNGPIVVTLDDFEVRRP